MERKKNFNRKINRDKIEKHRNFNQNDNLNHHRYSTQPAAVNDFEMGKKGILQNGHGGRRT